MLYLSSAGKEVRYGLEDGAGWVSADDQSGAENTNLVHNDANDNPSSIEELNRTSTLAGRHILLAYGSVAMSA
jgi:hypothetical protein